MEITTETESKFSKKIIALIILLCVVAGGVAWYFLYFTKTPVYSLNLIKKSVEKHDLEGFRKHVDLDSILSRGYEDLIAFTIENDKSMNDFQKNMVTGFAKMLKGTVVTGFRDGINRYVETGQWEIQDSKGQNGQQKVDTNEIANKTGLKKASFKGVAYSKIEGNNATIGIIIFDESIQKEVVLDVRMRKLNDGTWQIAELSNFKEYLTEIDKGKKSSEN